MIIEKTKLFFVKNRILKTIVILAIISLGLVYGIPYYRCYYTNASEGAKGVIGTLIGAIIGGGFTLLGTFTISNNAQRGINAIKRKNVIYKPIYDELMVIHNEILKENPFPHRIGYEKGRQTILRHPQYTAWGRIKNDARFFEVPEKLKRAMNELYASIEEYENSRNNAVDALDVIYRDEIRIIANREIQPQANVGDSLLAYVLTGERPNDDLLMWSFGSTKEEGADSLWKKLREHVSTDSNLKKCVDAKNVWMKKEEYVLNLLGVYIQYIIRKYEE